MQCVCVFVCVCAGVCVCFCVFVWYISSSSSYHGRRVNLGSGATALHQIEILSKASARGLIMARFSARLIAVKALRRALIPVTVRRRAGQRGSRGRSLPVGRAEGGTTRSEFEVCPSPRWDLKPSLSLV